jgi:hypothetical protein
VRLQARHVDDLAEALDNAIPGCRFRGLRGRYKDGPVRRALMRLATQHFDTNNHGWWYLKK